MDEVAVKSEEKQSKEEKMESLMKELGAKPYVKKSDGIAVKVEEDKEIKWEDHEGLENTLKVPSGSYVIKECNGWCPKVIPADEFEKKFGFVEEAKKEKKNPVNDVQIGLSALS